MDISPGIAILMKEHDNILAFTDLMERTCLQIFQGAAPDGAFFRRAISFIREYCDAHHHQKEEDLLFQAILRDLGPVGEKLVRHGMLVEHDLARLYVRQMEEVLNDLDKEDSDFLRMHLVASTMAYVDLLRRHALKENEVLYPYAQRELTRDVLARLDRDTLTYEEEKRAEGFFEKWADMLVSS